MLVLLENANLKSMSKIVGENIQHSTHVSTYIHLPGVQINSFLVSYDAAMCDG